MENKKIYIVDYAYGFDAGTCEPDYVSRLRSGATLRVLRKYPDANVVLGADMSDVTKGCGPLAGMTRKFLVSQGVSPSKIFLNTKGHDTLTETEAVYELIQKQGMGKIICTTSSFHKLRVWLIWLCRFGVFVKVASVWHKIPLTEWRKEMRKIRRDVRKALALRFRKT
jgi:hypothetical protein